MSEAVIDQTTYDELKDLVGEEFIGELVETFFEEAPGLLKAMRQALVDVDPETFRRSAHSLKSNSATFGATHLAALARELEVRSRDSDLEQAEPKLDELEAEYRRAAEALKAMI
ncbi:MAG TPA: Hpt domain-containing protein [candidate division Zixibacteria bacterium]|nr:Hpt domain-containing protein [candidate division Zixibacteria bacterium]